MLCTVCRLNGLRWVKSEALEAVKQVTQLDLRDNHLATLDLSSICSLEILHCQRNQLRALTLSGFTLRTLHASSNREWSTSLPGPVSPGPLPLLRLHNAYSHH